MRQIVMKFCGPDDDMICPACVLAGRKRAEEKRKKGR